MPSCFHVASTIRSGLAVREGLFGLIERQKFWRGIFLVWNYCNALKSHKTAKGIFGKAWRRQAEIWKCLATKARGSPDATARSMRRCSPSSAGSTLAVDAVADRVGSACSASAAAAMTSAAAAPARILVFDSGLGGLTVLAEISRARPEAEIVYAADDACFPYGALSEAALVDRVGEVVAMLIERFAPDLVVIACNTASTLVLAPLRARSSPRGLRRHGPGDQAGGVGVPVGPRLGAGDAGDGRARLYPRARPRFRERLRSDAGGFCAPGRSRGAATARRSGRRGRNRRARSRRASSSRGDRRTDQIVLACTHFPLLTDRFAALAPWPVAFVDPAPAIARRVDALLGPPRGARRAGPPFPVLFTSGRAPTDALQKALLRFGLGATSTLGIPLPVLTRRG